MKVRTLTAQEKLWPDGLPANAQIHYGTTHVPEATPQDEDTREAREHRKRSARHVDSSSQVDTRGTVKGAAGGHIASSEQAGDCTRGASCTRGAASPRPPREASGNARGIAGAGSSGWRSARQTRASAGAAGSVTGAEVCGTHGDGSSVDQTDGDVRIAPEPHQESTDHDSETLGAASLGGPGAVVEEAEGVPLHLSSKSSTGYKGVWKNEKNKLRAYSSVDGETVHLGTFGTAVDAALAITHHEAGETAGDAGQHGDEEEDNAADSGAAAADGVADAPEGDAVVHGACGLEESLTPGSFVEVARCRDGTSRTLGLSLRRQPSSLHRASLRLSTANHAPATVLTTPPDPHHYR